MDPAFLDQLFAGLPGVDRNHPGIKEALESITGMPERAYNDTRNPHGKDVLDEVYG